MTFLAQDGETKLLAIGKKENIMTDNQRVSR